MNPATYKQSFVESLSDQVIQALLTPIAQYYEANPAEKVTMERMVSILQLEDAFARRSRANTAGGIQAPTAFMDYASMGSVVPKTQKPKQPLAPGTPQCMYEFQKHPRRGQRCDNAAEISTGFCKACMRKASVKNMIQQGRTGMPPQSTNTRAANESATSLKVSRYGEHLRDEASGIVFKQNPNKTVEVMMVVDDTNTERGLTQDEANIAFSRGMLFTERTRLQDGVNIPTPGSVSAMLSAASTSKPAVIPTMNMQLPNINPQPFMIPTLHNGQNMNNQFMNPMQQQQPSLQGNQFMNPMQQPQQNMGNQMNNQFWNPMQQPQPSLNMMQPPRNPLLEQAQQQPNVANVMDLPSMGLPSLPQLGQVQSNTFNPTPAPQPQLLQSITPTTESPMNLAQVSNLPIPTVQSTPIQEQPKPEDNVITPGMSLNGTPSGLEDQYPLV